MCVRMGRARRMQQCFQSAAEASRGLCVICDEQAATWALLDCGHKVLCETCVRFFEAGPNGEPPRQTACPMCREPVARTLRIWD